MLGNRRRDDGKVGYIYAARCQKVEKKSRSDPLGGFFLPLSPQACRDGWIIIVGGSAAAIECRGCDRSETEAC